MTEEEGQKPVVYAKKNSLLATTMLGIGSVTGAGIYVLLGPAARVAGPAIIFAFAIDLIVAICIAGSYAECVSVLPVSGGGFMFIREAYGNKALFIGWIIWLSNIAYGAVCANAVGQFIAQAFGIPYVGFIIFISIMSIFLFTFLNIRGSTGLAKAQNPLIFALLASLVIGAVYLFLNPAGTPSLPTLDIGLVPIFTATALLLDVFIGFEDLCAISEEVQAPKKNVPRAMFLTIGIAGIFYFLVLISLVFTQDISFIQNSEIAFLDAVKGNQVVYFIAFIGAILSLLTSIGVALMAASHNLQALAGLDFIDRKWGEVHPKYQSPLRALFLTSFIAIIILLTGQVVFIASISNVSYIFSVIFVALAAIKFHKMKKHDASTFKMPFTPVSHYLAIGMCFLLVAFIGLDSIYVTLVWFLIGLFIYIFFSSKRRLYGTIFLIIVFFLTIANILVGVFVIIFGIVYYLFSIADKNSKHYVLSGLKLGATIFLGIFAYFIALSSSLTTDTGDAAFSVEWIAPTIFVIFIFSLCTSLFDIISMQEILTTIEKRRHKANIPIQFGEGSVVVLGPRSAKIAVYFNYGIGLVQIGCAIFLTIISIMLFSELIIVRDVLIGQTIIPGTIMDYVIKALLVLNAICLTFSGLMSIRASRDLQKIGILQFGDS